MTEIWKYINGYDNNYMVSNLGRVKSFKRNRAWMLKCTKNNYGYAHVKLHSKFKGKNMKVHRLVAMAFIPNPENKKEVNHKDGDKSNNKANNLEWATRPENIQHAFKTGLNKCLGERHHLSKLTEENVRTIKTAILNEESCYSIAKRFNVTETSIKKIKIGVSWKRVII